MSGYLAPNLDGRGISLIGSAYPNLATNNDEDAINSVSNVAGGNVAGGNVNFFDRGVRLVDPYSDLAEWGQQVAVENYQNMNSAGIARTNSTSDWFKRNAGLLTTAGVAVGALMVLKVISSKR